MEYEQSCGPKNQQKGRQLTWQKPQKGTGIFRGVARGGGGGGGGGAEVHVRFPLWKFM